MRALQIFLLLCLCITCTTRKSTNIHSWVTIINGVGSFSSPRAEDLNQDGIKDIVFGAGKVEFQKTDSAVFALNGLDGTILWKIPARDQIFGSPVFLDISGDDVADVVIGGRSAELMAIDGIKGTLLWRFLDDLEYKKGDKKFYNFYNPQIIRDIDGDLIQDILVANGGYVKAAPNDPDRPPGKLIVVSGKTGKVIGEAQMPDKKETYMSCVILDAKADDPRIVYGTGGERITGSLFICHLSEILAGDLTNSTEIASGGNKGFIAPPVLVDVNQDRNLDIIANAVDGKILAIDGKSLDLLWELDFPGTEIYCSLAVGQFNDDRIPDFFTNIGIGEFPDLLQSVQLAIDGENGSILMSDSLGTFHYSSPVVLDIDGDKIDEVIYHLNLSAMGVVKNVIKVFDVHHQNVFDFTSSFPGANLGSTPLLDDLDSDGIPEIIWLHENNPSDIFSINNKEGLTIHASSLEKLHYQPIHWGAYMGSDYTGRYVP